MIKRSLHSNARRPSTGSRLMAVGVAGLAGLVGMVVMQSPGAIASHHGEAHKSSSPATVETYAVDKVDRLYFKARGPLKLTQGDAPLLTVEGPANQLALLEISIDGEDLHISDEALRHKFRHGRHRAVTYQLTVAGLSRLAIGNHTDVAVGPLNIDDAWITIANHADVRFETLSAPAIELHTRNHADVRIQAVTADRLDIAVGNHTDLTIAQLAAKRLFVQADNHTDLRVAGQVNVQLIELDSHAEYRAKALHSNITHVDIKSHGEAWIRAREELYTSVARHGDLHVTGSPKVRSRSARED